MINYGILLFDVNKTPIKPTSTISTNTIYFYSYQIISCEIISGGAGDGRLYSSKVNNNGTVDNSVGTIFNDNFGYTLYLDKSQSVTIRISNTTGESKLYTFNIVDSNEISIKNQHYLDQLTNKHLPTYDELKQSFAEGYDDSMFIARMLLDYNDLMCNKGTKLSISKFLSLIGYDMDNINVTDEYKTPTGDKTILPNTLTDTKTGDYKILYDNYSDIGYDSNNLPLRYIGIQDLSLFKESLLKAINLANTYFTVVEQNIIFFGLTYSANIPNEQSITSHFNQIFDSRLFDFRKNVSISVHTHRSTTHTKIHVDNCLLVDNRLNRTEVKIIDNTNDRIKNIYTIDREVYDDELNTDTHLAYNYRAFGCILHIDIVAPNLFVEYDIVDINNQKNIYTHPKQFISDKVSELVMVRLTTKYILTVNIYDAHNNREQYFYELVACIDQQHIDFKLFSTGAGISSDVKYKYDLNLDVDTTQEVSTTSNNMFTRVLPIGNVLSDLSLYYTQQITKYYLSDTERYMLPEINKNLAVIDCTETLMVEDVSGWIDVITFEYSPSYQLMLRVTDIHTNKPKLINLNELSVENPIFDCLYAGVIDVYNSDLDINQTYWLIFTTQLGVNINIDTYDFVLVELNGIEVISAYDLIENQLLLPVNYDFPLLHIGSDTYPSVPTYISKTGYTEVIDGTTYDMVKSIYTRLVEISDATNDTYNMKIGDIVLCKLDNNLVVGAINVVWSVYDYFTNELIQTSPEYMLKFRIPELSIYNIVCNFLLDGESTNITKIAAFSSFDVETII